MDGGFSSEGIMAFLGTVWARFIDLLLAPLQEPSMLWFAIPLVIVTVMMALYFGRYRQEDLGWSSAFENSMVFLLISIDIFRKMYESAVPHSWVNILGNPLYFSIAIWLAVVSLISMVFLYYHLFPKRLAFFIYSKTPISISLYVVMAIVYAGVPADWATIGAGIVLFLIAYGAMRALQHMQVLSGKRHWEDEAAEKKRRLAEERAEGEKAGKSEAVKPKKKV